MNLQQVELDSNLNGGIVREHALWNARESSKTNQQTPTRILNARMVEFVAKPGMVQLLEDCVRGQIMDFLNRQSGFSGAIILKSHQERRLILVVSFWTTERMAADNCWERSRIVRQTAGSLIDACTRVHTYEAALADPSDMNRERSKGNALWPEVHE